MAARGLGKGLDSLIPKVVTEEPREEKKQEKEKYLLSLLGKVNYILQINPQDKLAKADQAIVKELLKTF